MKTKIYKDDLAVPLSIYTGLDLLEATYAAIKVLKPDNTTDELVGSVLNKSILYTTIAGDFNQTGNYYLQAYCKGPEWVSTGKLIKLKVY